MTSVLVVDDSQADIYLARQFLEQDLAASVCSAHTGREALAAIEGSAPDIVVTDLLLPDVDGLELLDAIHSRRPELPVILMAGFGSEDMAAEALRRGAASYLPKRNIAHDLVPAVSSVLSVLAPRRALGDLLAGACHVRLGFELESRPGIIEPLVTQVDAYLGAITFPNHVERTHVSIERDQKQWLEDNHINLSALVRDAIDQRRD